MRTPSSVSRRSVLQGAALIGVAVPLLSGEAGASGDSLGPRWISYGTHPRNDMHVTWSCGSAGTLVTPTAPQIRWGLTPSYGAHRAADSSKQVPVPAGDTGLPDQKTFYNTVLLSGLKAGTTYHYSVSNDGVSWTPDSHFTTAPKSLKTFRFTAFGDQATVGGTLVPMCKLVRAQDPAFHLHAGDLAYATPEPEHYPDHTGFTPSVWDRYLRGVGKQVAPHVPWQISVGAHEIEPLGQHGYAGFLTRFPQAYDHTSGTPVAHSFTYGNVAVIHLDGNEVSAQETLNTGYSNGAQTTWLARTLAAYRTSGSGIDFVVAVLNCCAYSSNQEHGSDGGVRDAWGPLFDKYHVDLVISGHVHAYERTHPVRAGKRTRVVTSGGTVHPADDGTTYICVGTGGNNLYPDWYGSSSAGDTGSATAPKVWRFSGGDAVSGGSGVPQDHADSIRNYSAYRSASYVCLVVDVTPPTAKSKQTTMAIRALRPSQKPGSVTSISKPKSIDSVTLVRTSTIQP